MLTSLQAYFVEKQNEVDSKGDKKRQEAEVVEVSGQVILWKQSILYKFLIGNKWICTLLPCLN